EDNYLIPARTDLRFEGDVRFKAIGQERIVEAIRGSGAAAGVIILDACRDNALEREVKSAGTDLRGLGPQAGTDLLVAYSAAAGKWAYNIDGQESAFTTALTEEIVKPGPLTDVMYRVRARVINATRLGSRGVQEPELLSQLTQAIALVPDDP